ncbi:MAG: 50S ribosomal protein L24 [Dehalococcoidales bacterium]|jgi:large subunit ribosomal protein L24|nr:50S ribosomal protein L24 [Dehalococcoidales bacterium]MDD3264473.1 50S ribosomal protein L24 [Dehalococcoidales bacterium]MDD4322004.1 50S ribosomal protein L24 [Dehalococcoidales bacterium]MDD4793903.1 50S ribosomal protein L24 [Dehalococcoidales bacterium]MDD5122091.1 50S ribosomal protein L24 [Dehalococcoidales bacterium]
MKIKKNDTVLVTAGKDKGKKGKVRQAIPGDTRVLVDGINMVKKHARPTKQARQAGIIEREESLDISNVMYLCDKCHKPARLGYRILDDGKKVRYCKSCKEVVD